MKTLDEEGVMMIIFVFPLSLSFGFACGNDGTMCGARPRHRGITDNLDSNEVHRVYTMLASCSELCRKGGEREGERERKSEDGGAVPRHNNRVARSS